VLVAAGTWLAYGNRDSLATLTQLATKEPEPPSSVATASLETPEPPAQAQPVAESPDTFDARLQKLPQWDIIKREFPDWYGERLKEAAALSADKKPDEEIFKHLADGLVSLRRQHAQTALSASTNQLKAIAAAFLENLRTLAGQGTEACYGFISSGETSPAVVELMKNPEKSVHVNAQLASIFTAIAEGRKSPVTHAAPQKSDYDVLAAQLGRLGWTTADIQLFADPRALAHAPHERVCKMVQDWFAAHLAVEDAAVQERLLFETLRPVVAG
jgi:hypothetical protein